MCLTIVKYLQPLTNTTPARRNSRVQRGVLFYSVRIDDDELLETDKFHEKILATMHNEEYAKTFESYGQTPEYAYYNFQAMVVRMREKGFLHNDFKQENAAVRLFPHPDTPFRLYALQWRNFAILGNGGIKPIEKRTYQETPDLKHACDQLLKLDRKIKHRGLTFCDDYFTCDDDDFYF